MEMKVLSWGLWFPDNSTQSSAGVIKSIQTGYYDFVSGVSSGTGEDLYYKEITINSVGNKVLVYIQSSIRLTGSNVAYEITGKLINDTTLRLCGGSNLDMRCRWYVLEFV